MLAEIERLKVEIEMNRTNNGNSFWLEENKFGKDPKLIEYEEEIKVLQEKLIQANNNGKLIFN